MKKQSGTTIQYLQLLLLSVLIFSAAFLQAQDDVPSIFESLQFDDVIKVTLETDIENLKTNRRFTEEQDGTLSYKDKEGQEHSWKLDISLRGRFRRTFSKQIPPLKIKFKKKELKAAGLDKYDDYKLVTFFAENEKDAKKILLKEFLAYRLFNRLTDKSFRVQLMKIKYIDSNTGEKDDQWAFIIEDTAELRDRLEANKTGEWIILDKTLLDTAQLNMVCLFQYMIGNSDWSLDHGKNLKTFFKSNKILVVPFDFDFSGMVNAYYAVPDNSLNIKSVRDRIYMNKPDDLNSLASTVELFEQKEKELIQEIKKFKHLNLPSRIGVESYISDFFKELKIRKKKNLSFNDDIL